MPARYQITVKGHLDSHWSAWFDTMTITNTANGESILDGELADQSALHAVLTRIRDVGLTLLAVTTVTTDGSQPDTL